MDITIQTFDELIQLIESNDLTENKIETLIQKTVNVLVITDIDKEFNKTELINDLKEFWSKWGNKPITERPIFLMKDPLE